MSTIVDIPRDLLASHPETAYFWGRVAGDGELETDCVTVRTTDETAARRLAGIAGGASIDRRIRERDYAHDTSITRTEDEFTVQVFGAVAKRAAGALGFPIDDEPGGYRFEALGHERAVLRGLLEGCGTICYKSTAETVGISFVHTDEQLLGTIQSLLASIPVEAPVGELSETSSGGYWFGIEDQAVPEFGRWLYAGSEETGLFAPSRRRKLTKSIEQAE